MINIEYYSDIDTTPYVRYHKFIKYLTLQSEVGNSAESIPQRADRALGYITSNDLPSAIAELSNLKMLHSFIKNDIIPEGLANAVMVKSIDGVECNDLTLEGLNKVLLKLDSIGTTKKQVAEKNEEVKKKYHLNWRCIFPKFLRGKT